MSRPVVIPAGVFPPRMAAPMAAGYCGECSVESFLAGVRARLYPEPRVKRGRRQIWAKEDLDRAINPAAAIAADVALDL